jgi:hypothetical protein
MHAQKETLSQDVGFWEEIQNKDLPNPGMSTNHATVTFSVLTSKVVRRVRNVGTRICINYLRSFDVHGQMCGFSHGSSTL